MENHSARRATSGLSPTDCPAYVLAGGQSRRFGSDKLLARVDGDRQIDRINSFLRGQQFPVVVVADVGDRFPGLGVPVISDSIGKGPLAGLLAAAENRQGQQGEGWFLLVPGDQFTWCMQWFVDLAVGSTNARLASVFEDATGGLQPLPGLYHSSIAFPIRQAIVDGRLSLCGFLNGLRHGDGKFKRSTLIGPVADFTEAEQAVCVRRATIAPNESSFNTQQELDAIMSKAPQSAREN